MLSLLRFALPLLFVVFASGCDNGDCKCAPCYSCTLERDPGEVGLVSPAAPLTYDREDVLAMVEGTWKGEGIEVVVAGGDGEALINSVFRYDESCDIPKRAANVCAGMEVPVAITGTLDGRPFYISRLEIRGTKLGTGDAKPSDDSKGLPWAYAEVDGDAGPRTYAMFVFTPGGLWRKRDEGGKYDRVAVRE